MLKVHVNEYELFNERTNEFEIIPATDLTLEHSLISISKWESKWKKPFLTNEKHTNTEMLDYIRCMTITQNVSEATYISMTYQEEVLKKIYNYIDDKMTATTFSDRRQTNPGSSLPVTKRKNRIITSELIYCWMIQQGIPLECQTWHINRLLTLIRVINIEENSGNNKMSKRDILSSNRSLNQARRQRLNSRG